MVEGNGGHRKRSILSSMIYDLGDGQRMEPHIPEEYRAPDGSPPRLYQSALAVQMSELGVHRLALEEASAALRLLADLVANEAEVTVEEDKRRLQALMRALGVGVAVSYFRCFTSPSVHKLDYALVHREEAAMRSHQQWLEVRDKHFAHDVNDQRQGGVGLLATAVPLQYHILTNQVSLLPSAIDVQTWEALVVRSLAYVHDEEARVSALLAEEVSRLTVDEIMALPAFAVRVGGASTRKASRRNKGSATRKGSPNGD